MVNLEDPARAVDDPGQLAYKIIYRRRGSDLIFGAAADGRLVVGRYNHRVKTTKWYVHPEQEIRTCLAELKQYMEVEGYKHVEDGFVAADGTLTTTAPADLSTSTS